LYQHITVICCEETRTDWERNTDGGEGRWNILKISHKHVVSLRFLR